MSLSDGRQMPLRGVCIGKVGSRVPLPPLHHSRVLTESRTEWGGAVTRERSASKTSRRGETVLPY